MPPGGFCLYSSFSSGVTALFLRTSFAYSIVRTDFALFKLILLCSLEKHVYNYTRLRVIIIIFILWLNFTVETTTYFSLGNFTVFLIQYVLAEYLSSLEIGSF